MHARKKGPEPGSVRAQSEAMKDVLARCHEKAAAQVSTLIIMHYYPITININAMIACASFWYWQPDLASLCTSNVILMGVYFSQVKKKPWHPWVHTWFRHHREQKLSYIQLHIEPIPVSWDTLLKTLGIKSDWASFHFFLQEVWSHF